jgi:hypothetical protein
LLSNNNNNNNSRRREVFMFVPLRNAHLCKADT